MRSPDIQFTMDVWMTTRASGIAVAAVDGPGHGMGWRRGGMDVISTC